MSLTSIFRRILPATLWPAAVGLREVVRDWWILERQKRLLAGKFSRDARSAILFLTLGYDLVNGGILSICSICEETAKLGHLHDSQTLLCTSPGQRALLRYTKFSNRHDIFTLPGALRYFRNLERLLLHVPECCVGELAIYLSQHPEVVSGLKSFHINVLLQNIKLIPCAEDMEILMKVAKLSCTTAHEKYSGTETNEKLGCPVHHLSTYVSPKFYQRVSFDRKDDLMIVSPDEHPLKNDILSVIQERYPDLRLRIIKDMSYEEYKREISRAKWAISFGEGLDGYFVETIFSGGIGFAVFNNDFFTDDFAQMSTVYSNYESMMNRVCGDLDRLSSAERFVDYQEEQFQLCQKHYDYSDYTKNIINFYSLVLHF